MANSGAKTVLTVITMKMVFVALASVVLGLVLGVGAGYWRYNFSPGATQKTTAAAAGTSREATGPQPVAYIDETEYQFGSMEQGKTMSHEFTIFNRGAAPLTLKTGDTTCKCTLSQLEDDQIPPGKSGTVSLEWRAETQPGEFRQSAIIHTNDPQRPEITLVVNGEVTQSVTLSPTEVVFTSLPANQPTSAEVKVLSFHVEDFEITSHSFESPEGSEQFEVAVDPLPADEITKNKAKSGVLVTVTSKHGLPLGPIRHKIVLETNVEGAGKLELPLQGSVTSDISILGPSFSSSTGVLRLGLVDSRKGAEASLKLITRGRHSGDVQFELGSKRPEFLEVEIGEKKEFAQGAASQVPVTIRVPKAAPAVDHSGSSLGKLAEVRLKTTHPEVPEVHILVQFVVKD